jgi:hypothetical protein
MAGALAISAAPLGSAGMRRTVTAPAVQPAAMARIGEFKPPMSRSLPQRSRIVVSPPARALMSPMMSSQVASG